MNLKHRFDFYGVTRRISTFLSVLSASATTSLGAYAFLPERAQSTFPEWTLAVLGGISVVSVFLIPVATSFKQNPKVSP